MNKKMNRKVWELLFLLLFVLILPLGNLLGWISINTVSLWGRYCCFALAALGVDLIWGYTGMLSMCQAVFFCMGGYGVGMYLSLEKAVHEGGLLPDFMSWNNVADLPFFWKPFAFPGLAFLLAFLTPAVFAFFIGYLLFKSRIRGVYMAIITQALCLAIWLLFLRNETMLGGTNGLTGFRYLLGFDLANPITKLMLYGVSVLLLLTGYRLSHGMVRSKFGKVLLAIRDSESRVAFTAYPVLDYKLLVFVFAAMLAAVAGMLYVPQTGIITPGRMDVKASVEMVMWVALGGRASLKGAVLGALLVNFMYSVCTSWFPDSWLFVLGGLFVLNVLFLEKGLFGVFEKVVFPISGLGNSWRFKWNKNSYAAQRK